MHASCWATTRPLRASHWGGKRRLYRSATEAVDKALKYAYRDRRARKRDFRRLWIARINAAARLNDLSYSRMMNGLNMAGIEINRKILSELAATDEAARVSTARAATSHRAGAGPDPAVAAAAAPCRKLESPSAAAKSRAVTKRSAGTFSRALRITASVICRPIASLASHRCT